MSLREFFPQYPFSMITPRKANIKFGSHDIYVDLPWQTYAFFEMIRDKAEKNNLDKEEVKDEWINFLQQEKESLIFNNKPIVRVSLRSDTLSNRLYLRLDVEWQLFEKYLEERSKFYLSQINENGVYILKFYRDSWINYFIDIRRIAPSKPDYSRYTVERFKKLLDKTGDYDYIENILRQFEELLNRVEVVLKGELPSVQLYTTNLLMSIYHLHTLIESINLTAAYVLLRNFLESFMKLFIYIDAGNMVKEYPFLDSMFLYEYETMFQSFNKQRMYSLKKFRTETRKKLLKIVSNTSSENRLDIFQVLSQLNEEHLVPLGINVKVIEEFSEEYDLKGADLDKLYSACSSIIHNQPPLPFFSLLEVKLFKNFLEKYLSSMQIIAEKIIDNKMNKVKI